MDKEITLITLHNSLDIKDRTTELIPYEHKTLADIKSEHLPKEIDFHMAVNGQVIKEEELGLTIPSKGDCVIAVSTVRYDVILYIIEAIVTALVVDTLTVGTAEILMVGAAYVIGTLVYGGLMIGAALLINSLFGPNTPADSNGGGGSNLYSWNPQNTNRQGVPIPKMYGEYRTYGNIISTYTESIDDNGYLNILACVNHGVSYEISDFKVNDQVSTEFSNVSVDVRYGYNDQTPVLAFDNTKLEYEVARKVMHDTPVNYVTNGDTFDQLEVVIAFPKGLYIVNDQGQICPHGVGVQIILSCVEDPTAVVNITGSLEASIYSSTIRTARWSLGQYKYREQLTDLGFIQYVWLWVECEAGSSNPADHIEGDTQTFNPSEGLFFPCTWKWLAYNTTYYKAVFKSYTSCVKNDWVQTTDAIFRTFSTVIPKKGHYNIKVTKISNDWVNSRVGEETNLYIVREVYNNDFSYPRLTLVSLRALATDQLSGSLRFSCLLKGSLIRVYDGSDWTVEYSKNPAWVCYDILTQPVFNDPSRVCTYELGDLYFSPYIVKWYRCISSHTSDLSNKPVNTTYWKEAESPLTYGSWAVGVTFSTDAYIIYNSVVYRCKLGHVCSAATEPGVGASWGDYWVDCLWKEGQSYVDITDAGVNRYDGFNPSMIDYATFKEWADFCDVLVNDGNGGVEKRFEFNGGFDSETTMWEAAIKVCNMSRAILFWNGSLISIVIDQSATPVQLFSMGNILLNSFTETFLPLEDRASELSLSFANSEDNYNIEEFTVFNTALNTPSNKTSVQLIGVTKASQAWRTGEFLLLCNQYLKKTITFKASIDAIACTLGSVINFQHDVPRWGLAGGRIVSATVSTVTLDQAVTIEAGKNYAIMIRLSDDTLVTKVISTLPGSYTTLDVSTPFTVTPAQYDVYAFGESDTVTKPFRVQSLEKTGDQEITLVCIEYNENIYSVDTGTPILPEVEYSAFEAISPVTNLLLTEEVYFTEAGAVKRDIKVSFNKPTNPRYKSAVVYYQMYDPDSLSYGSLISAGETTSNQLIIKDVLTKKTYKVFVCSVSYTNVMLADLSWPGGVITISSDSPLFTSVADCVVTGLEVFGKGNVPDFEGRDCRVRWNPSVAIVSSTAGAEEEVDTPDVYLKDYEVEIYTLGGVKLRTEYTPVNEYIYTFEKNCEDSATPNYEFEFRVKARDLFGNISNIAARLAVNNTLPLSVTNPSAIAVVGGVQFKWDKNSDLDLQGYYVRTAIGTAGFNEWSKIVDNSFLRMLTSEEVAAYGSNALVYAEIRALDVFNQYSSTVSVNTSANALIDDIFQLVGSKNGGTGNVADLYNGVRSSGGVTI